MEHTTDNLSSALASAPCVALPPLPPLIACRPPTTDPGPRTCASAIGGGDRGSSLAKLRRLGPRQRERTSHLAKSSQMASEHSTCNEAVDARPCGLNHQAETRGSHSEALVGVSEATNTHIYMCVFIELYLYTHIPIYAYTYMQGCTYTCKHLYIYMQIHKHACPHAVVLAVAPAARFFVAVFCFCWYIAHARRNCAPCARTRPGS